MKYVVELSKVKKVVETTDLIEVNEKIRNGWMLLCVVTTNQGQVLFSLGRVKVG